MAPQWGCLDCTTPYVPGLARCPHCGSTRYTEEGNNMPKIGRINGPTNAAEPDEPAPVSLDSPDPEAPAEADSAPSVDYSALTVAELRDECKRRDLPTSGSKDVLVARLTEQG